MRNSITLRVKLQTGPSNAWKTTKFDDTESLFAVEIKWIVSFQLSNLTL